VGAWVGSSSVAVSLGTAAGATEKAAKTGTVTTPESIRNYPLQRAGAIDHAAYLPRKKDLRPERPNPNNLPLSPALVKIPVTLVGSALDPV
jgi:hypothetical protein